MSERTLVRLAYRKLKCVDGIAVSLEVPLAGRLVDLVYVKSERVFTVEFKLSDWRRALAQARDHLLGADMAFVCMPPRRITEAMWEEFRRAGIGLVFFQAEAEWPFESAIEALPSKEVWAVARDQVYNTVVCRPARKPGVYV